MPIAIEVILIVFVAIILTGQAWEISALQKKVANLQGRVDVLWRNLLSEQALGTYTGGVEGGVAPQNVPTSYGITDADEDR